MPDPLVSTDASLVISPAPDVRPARLSAEDYAARFDDAVPALGAMQAVLAAERCLYCYDAPCQAACPTGIDVPSFIRRISDGNLRGAAHAILDANPLGGICARVCPTEELCEQVCVRNTQEGKPVEIGRLQRHAVDAVMNDAAAPPLFTRALSTGKRVAVIGAGPAGLACAHVLARLGHDVVIHDAHAKGGGLNEYGLAAYKTAGGFAQRELAWLMGIGGIELVTGWRLESPAQLGALRQAFDAVFIGIGLDGVQRLAVPGETLAGVRDAVDFIADLRQADDLSRLPIGRRVVVIGGGMTAVDAAVQARLLGAEEVHIVYRRGPQAMSASLAEQEWAQTNGVRVHHLLVPVEIVGSDGAATGVKGVTGVTFERQEMVDGVLRPTGILETLAADMVFKAIGQRLDADFLGGDGLTLRDGRVVADDDGVTGLAGVWAGGDCRAGGRDLTVEAVQDGKRAARSIDAALRSSAALA